jgi:hypothetical protein
MMKKEKIIMKIAELLTEMKTKKIQNTQVNPDAVGTYLRKNLEIKTYIPFEDKKRIAEMIIAANLTEENGIKKIDSVGQFISFVTAMLVAHTSLQINTDNPIEDYNLICEAGLLEPIIAEFQKDYAESEVILKMMVADELADNNLSIVVARFLDGVLDVIGGFSDSLSDVVNKVDVDNLLGDKFDVDDLVKLKGFLDKYN